MSDMTKTSRRAFLRAGVLGLTGYAAAGPHILPSWAAKSEPVEALVIGSGFGGAVAALRLAEAGVQTLLLERGRRWPVMDPTQNATFATLRRPDGRSGWLRTSSALDPSIPIDVYAGVLEIRPENGTALFLGAGVGGGSLVYNGVTYQPTRANFDRVFGGLLDYDEMNAVYYPRVRAMLDATPIPHDILHTEHYRLARVTLEQAAAAGLRGLRLDMALDWDAVRAEIAGTRVPSAIDGEFWYGNNSGCKNSLDRNYLRDAERSGYVEIAPLHVVTAIRDAPGHRFFVDCNRIDEGGNVLERKTLTARRVFLAAGSIGTSELLVRAKARGTLRKLNDAVGRYWGNNGDTFGLRVGLPRTNPSQGGPAAIGIEDHENPLVPTTIMTFPQWNETQEGYLYHLGLAIPPPKGVFRYDPAADQARLTWPAADPEIVRIREAAALTCERLNRANTADGYQPATAFIGDGGTSHPLGGAVLGAACDRYGRVKGYKNLYVVDGALIPGSTGCTNPSLTIAALAERSLERIVREDVK